MLRWIALLFAVGCTHVDLDARDQRILTTIADDNDVFAHREPELVRMKLHKMQRTPFTWLRGTASLYWRDLTEPGALPSPYSDAASSRVLLIGDPHVENVGTFRASDEELWVYRLSDHMLSDGVDWAQDASPTGMSYARKPDKTGPFVTGAASKGLSNP